MFLPGYFHLASEDQVTAHKKLILKRIEKYAVAKYQTGFVSMHEVCSAIYMPLTPRYTDLVMEDKPQKKMSTLDTWFFAKRRYV